MPSYRQDYYRILQVHPEAEPEVIQAAYRRLARMHHPDTGSGTGAQMQLLNEAYGVLSDARQRSDYDRWYRLHSFRSPFGAASPPPSAPASAPAPAPASAPAPQRPLFPGILLRPILSTFGLTLILSFLALDMFRLGIRGLPEITVILLVLVWLVYRFGGFRGMWRG